MRLRRNVRWLIIAANERTGRTRHVSGSAIIVGVDRSRRRPRRGAVREAVLSKT